MTRIRVNPSILREASTDLSQFRSLMKDVGHDVQSVANNAPSYDGQFSPKVQSIGAEAISRAQVIANGLTELSQELLARASAFEAADQAGVVGFTGLSVRLPFRIEWPPWLRPPKIPPWIWEFLIGLIPFGDAYDIIKQAINSIRGEEVDELILALAALGLAADAGWLQPFPSAEDAPNVGLAALKAIAKQIPTGPARDALAEIVEQAAKNPDDLKRLSEVLIAFTKHDELIQSLTKNHDALLVALKNGPEAVELIAKYGDDGVALVGRYGQSGLELLMKRGDDIPLHKIEELSNLPIQKHHLLSNKFESKWTPIFEEVTDKYGLSINGDWNILEIPHKGSHAPQYHEWINNRLTMIDQMAAGDTDTFLELFDELIKKPIAENPLLLRREWWP